MSLDVSLVVMREVEIFEANITHNLNKMAEAAGVYLACWRPEEIGAQYAKDIVPILEDGIAAMKAKPVTFSQFNAKNGWGTYENFLPWLEKYLAACKENPNAEIRVSR